VNEESKLTVLCLSIENLNHEQTHLFSLLHSQFVHDISSASCQGNIMFLLDSMSSRSNFEFSNKQLGTWVTGTFTSPIPEIAIIAYKSTGTIS
jgi:hypothetical protein